MQREKIFLVIWCILLPLFLLLLSYKLTLAFSFLTPAQDNVFQFLDGNEKLNQNYTATEISHLEDVVRVMNGANIFWYASGTIILILSFYFWKDKEQLQKALRYGGMATVAFIAVILMAILVGFEEVFTLFHLLFFPQGNWQFAADSLLIQTFPLDFFIMMGRRIFMLALAFGVMLISTAYLMKKKMKIKN